MFQPKISKQFAKKFIQNYQIDNLTSDFLKNIIPKLGYSIIEFNPLYNNESVQQLISTLSLEHAVKHHKCFTYDCELVRFVFISDTLNDSESIIVLLHEIGHIYMGHMPHIHNDSNIEYEDEANIFSYWVRKIIHQNARNKIIRKKVIYISIYIILFLRIILNCYALYIL